MRQFVEFYLKNGEALSKEVKYIPLPSECYQLGLDRLKAGKTGTVFGGVAQVGVKPVGTVLERTQELKAASIGLGGSDFPRDLVRKRNGTSGSPQDQLQRSKKGVTLRPLKKRGGQTVRMRVSRFAERLVEAGFFLAACSSVLITVGIVGVLVYEASTFFSHVSIKDFLTDTQWTPLFSDAHYGIMSLVCGTLVTTLIALAVAIPVGTIVAIYLSEYAPLSHARSSSQCSNS